MTAQQSTSDTTYPMFHLPDARDADEHRAYVIAVRDQLAAAENTVRAVEELADQWHRQQVLLPPVAEHADAADVFDPSCPAPASASTRLQRSLTDAAQQAYLIAGHYRRASRVLGQTLADELAVGANPVWRVLSLDALDQLGYLRASDEWCALADPLDDVGQVVAHELQQAGLLPRFDEHFPPAATAPAPPTEENDDRG